MAARGFPLTFAPEFGTWEVVERGAITRARTRDIDSIVWPETRGKRRDRAMTLPGFDEEFGDIVEYILRITYRIWELNQPEMVRSYYAEDCVIHTLGGPVTSAEQVVENTRATLKAFPDRKLFGDEVIWSDEGDAGFYTSHRITSPMTHLGDGHWGAPTGRSARVRTVADCLVRDNVIYEEWLMRDGLSMALQLGLEPHALARRQAGQARENQALQEWLACELARIARSPGRREHFGYDRDCPAGRACELLQAIWIDTDFTAVTRGYSPVARLHGPSGRELFGHEEIAHHQRALLGGLADTAFSIDHVAANSVEQRGRAEASVALRWTLGGVYDKPGIYGAPTGAPVFLLGATHFDMVEGKVVEEWTVFDELSVLAQVHGAIR